jgi:hypothetical protein
MRGMAKKTIRKKVIIARPLICSACGLENEPSATECVGCQKTRFEPEWVLAKVPVNRQTSVQATLSSAEFGDQEQRLTKNSLLLLDGNRLQKSLKAYRRQLMRLKNRLV